MAEQQTASRVLVPLSLGMLNGRPISKARFLDVIRQLPLGQLLPGLIKLLQYGDAKEPPAFEMLDRRVSVLFPTETARRIGVKLKQEGHLMFFSKWQLLLAIKLICAFGSRDDGAARIRDGEFLNFLLMVNGFYPGGENAPNTDEGAMEAVQEATLRGYSLIEYERPHSLIGRYAELFEVLAAESNRSDFSDWINIRDVMSTTLGIQLDAFKAVLFALYARSVIGASWPDDGTSAPQLGNLHPKIYFANTKLPKDELHRALELVTTSPEEIREWHLSQYGESIGNPVDHRILLRKPVIKLRDDSVAGVSGQLLVQRYTCGLYWDIHDVLPDDKSTKPNREMFQRFFGQLHERYGLDTLERIVDCQKRARKKAYLMSERDYPVGEGSNPDSLLVETVGSLNTRCTLFEFKVGRPRYVDSLVQGDVQAFQEDLHKKIEDGISQEIDFCQRLLSGERTITDLSAQNVTKWFFVIVVTDPFPAMSLFLQPLREKLAAVADCVNAQLHGPFILSLSEIEQLETLSEKRVSDLLFQWANGPERDWPFHSFYARRIKGRSIAKPYVAKRADDDMNSISVILLGDSALTSSG